MTYILNMVNCFGNHKSGGDNIKVIFVAVNSKYIHSSPAVRLLTKVAGKKYDASFCEFSIKDKTANIVNSLSEYDAIGLSCYIWNISIMKEIAIQIKQQFPSKTVFAGGPEVSFEPQEFVDYFDYVLCGEGEEMIVPFLDGIDSGIVTCIPGVADSTHPFAEPQTVKDLTNIPDVSDLYSQDDLNNKIIYAELSRGCPFNCTYCLSSLEKSVRIFDDEHCDKVLSFIENNKIKCIKFLDRTFNVNPERFISICKRLQKTNNIYQFEIEAELFNERVIDFLCNEVFPQKFRLEIGIQSFNNNVVKAVNRHQNSERLFNIIRKINEAGRCTVHADLIAGLPYETLESFKASFNLAFKLQCEELQLGFLKMLRGTDIRNKAELFDYKFSEKEPYEVTENRFMTEYDFSIIHHCEESLEWLWNSGNAVSLLKHLIKDNAVTDWFDFFVGFFPYYDKTAPLHKNFEALCSYIESKDYLNKEYIDDLKYDYLSKVKVRPQPFWKNYAYEDLCKLKKHLASQGKVHENSYVTTYYDGFLVIDYSGSRPILSVVK